MTKRVLNQLPESSSETNFHHQLGGCRPFLKASLLLRQEVSSQGLYNQRHFLDKQQTFANPLRGRFSEYKSETIPELPGQMEVCASVSIPYSIVKYAMNECINT